LKKNCLLLLGYSRGADSFIPKDACCNTGDGIIAEFQDGIAYFQFWTWQWLPLHAANKKK
jgi:hypothetical protein